MLMCKICIAGCLVVDIFPWSNANFVPFPSGTLVARWMRNGRITDGFHPTHAKLASIACILHRYDCFVHGTGSSVCYYSSSSYTHIFLNHVVSFNPEQIPNLRAIVEWVNPRGGTHIFGRTGMCHPNGSLFYKKSLNMGPGFYPKKILKHGSIFLTEPQITWFSGFSPCKNPENCGIFEK